MQKNRWTNELLRIQKFAVHGELQNNELVVRQKKSCTASWEEWHVFVSDRSQFQAAKFSVPCTVTRRRHRAELAVHSVQSRAAGLNWYNSDYRKFIRKNCILVIYSMSSENLPSIIHNLAHTVLSLLWSSHFLDPPGNHPRGAIFPTVD